MSVNSSLKNLFPHIRVRGPSDLEGAVTFLPEYTTKNYTVPEGLSFVIGIQKHLYSMKKEKR